MGAFSKIIPLFAILLLSFLGFSQKKLTVDAPYKNRALYPQTMRNLQWIIGTDKFTYIDGDFIKIESAKSKDTSSISLTQINSAMSLSGFSTLSRLQSIEWISAVSFQMNWHDSVFEINTQKFTASFKNVFPSESEYVKKESAHNKIAFTKENNLFIFDNGKETAVTNDTEKGIVNGQTVSRSEFGIEHGIFWSPKGNLLAYYKKDESKVSEYPLVNIDPSIAVVENTRYPMAGSISERVEVYIYNPANGKTIQLQTGAPVEQYQTNVTWSPDEKYIFISELNRAQNHMQLKLYDAVSGNLVKVLLEEKNPKYVEPEDPIYFLNANANQFVMLSERDGFKHAYLFDFNGKLIRQLTSGKWMILDFYGFNTDNSKCFFTSTQESPIEKHLYSLELKTGKINKLTQISGTHDVILNEAKTYFLDSYSNATSIAREYALSSSKGEVLRILRKNINPLADYKLGEMTISTLKSDNGVDLYYRLIKPVNFDSTKKYPVIVYVYGGPHAQMITNSWLGGSGFWLQALASEGFVVFTLDNQGSANRGFEFESIIHRQVGTQEMKDQMKGIEFLKSLSYVDANRIGVDGWSYGGFMTTNLKLTYPDVFKVAVAGGPVINWAYYEVMYGERYMDTPQENPDGYKNNNLLNKVDKLQGKLMIIHGTVDPTVVWQNSLKFIQECVKKQKQVDYFVYPGHEHNVRGMDRLHLETKIFEYFRDNL